MIASFPGDSSKRRSFERYVDKVLAGAKGGRIVITKETGGVDFKEEAGRRRGSTIEAGKTTNPVAANHLADEVACMANTPGGGVLVVGIEDKNGTIIGTELDIDWLRQEIYTRIDVAPSIESREVEGQRVLIIYTAPAAEPVEDTHGKIRWRVGDSCRLVDRSEWWEYQRSQVRLDPTVALSSLTSADIAAGALTYARANSPLQDDLPPDGFLRRIGAIDASDRLSIAGGLLFAPLDRVALELTVFDVEGGQITNRIVPDSALSGLEQLDEIERALRALIKNTTVEHGFHHTHIPAVPTSAVREALLNAMIHRDWNRTEPIDVRWIELDSTLTVRSPGGFPPHITSENVLSNRAARYPALADLYRAIGLVDKQGVGVDRMYQAMISLGHRPPEIQETAGPFVETTLRGGQPVESVMTLMRKMVPEARQRDYRIAIILNCLFERPFISIQSLAHALQSTEEAARMALNAALQTMVDSSPIVEPLNEAWILGPTCRAILTSATTSPFPQAPYLSTDASHIEKAAKLWLTQFAEISTSELMALNGVSRGTAAKTLAGMVERDVVRPVGEGRSRRYTLSNR